MCHLCVFLCALRCSGACVNSDDLNKEMRREETNPEYVENFMITLHIIAMASNKLDKLSSIMSWVEKINENENENEEKKEEKNEEENEKEIVKKERAKLASGLLKTRLPSRYFLFKIKKEWLEKEEHKFLKLTRTPNENFLFFCS